MFSSCQTGLSNLVLGMYPMSIVMGTKEVMSVISRFQ